MHNSAGQPTTPAPAIAGRGHPARSTGHLPGHQAHRPTHPHPATRPGATGLSANAAATANSPYRAHNSAATASGDTPSDSHTERAASSTPIARAVEKPWRGGRRCTSVSGSLTLSPGLQGMPGGSPRTATQRSDDQGVHATGKGSPGGYAKFRELAARVITDQGADPSNLHPTRAQALKSADGVAHTVIPLPCHRPSSCYKASRP
jgi:hypothetical protein